MLTPGLARVLAERFDLGAHPRMEGPVARGELGQVWRLTTRRGRYAVKDPFFDVDAEACERDAAYQDRVRDAGVPMPAVVRSVGWRVTERIGGTTVRVYEWVDVLPRDRTLHPSVVGRTLAAIHRVGLPTEETIEEWYADPVGEDRWRELADRLERSGAPFAEDLRRTLPIIAAAERLVRRSPAVQLCHRDLWADNLLATPAGGVMVMDWENCGPAVPSQELMVVLAEFGARWRVDRQDGVRALVTAYEDAGGPARLTGPEDATMLVAQLGHIAEEGGRRWLASTSPSDRAHNEAWVRELLDEPPTVALVEAILEAALA